VAEKGGGDNPQHVAVGQPEAKGGRRQSRLAEAILTSGKEGNHARGRGKHGHGHGRAGLAEPPLPGIESESENDGERKSPWP